jgi:hypothetical protein
MPDFAIQRWHYRPYIVLDADVEPGGYIHLEAHEFVPPCSHEAHLFELNDWVHRAPIGRIPVLQSLATLSETLEPECAFLLRIRGTAVQHLVA